MDLTPFYQHKEVNIADFKSDRNSSFRRPGAMQRLDTSLDGFLHQSFSLTEAVGSPIFDASATVQSAFQTTMSSREHRLQGKPPW
jgi:hypothetical protein